MNDFLDFFLMKNGKFNVNFEESQPKNAVIELIEMFKIVASEKNIVLHYAFDENIPNQLILD